MLFVLFVFIIPSIICAFLGFYFCIHHNVKAINNFDDLYFNENILLLQQQEKNCLFSQTSPLLLNNNLNKNNSKYIHSLPLRPLPSSMQRYFGNEINWQIPSTTTLPITSSFNQKPILCPPPPEYSSKIESKQQLKSALCSFASAF